MKEIFNIFSGKKIKEIPKRKIIVDFREKNSLVASEIVKLGFEVEFQALKVGDYLVNGIAIERKTVSDFRGSMVNRRLLRQLEELQQYQKKILVIEGIYDKEIYPDNENNSEGIHPNAIRGFLLSILLKYNVPIIYTKDSEDTAKFISVLAKKAEKENPLNVSKKNLTKSERMQFILEGFPGIGPKIARKLLEKFKTIKNIMNASEEEITEVIGKKAEVFKIVSEEF
ncbi:hypothetical protein HY449_03980 [Candidatus Pacearchaeota archaeon]|nr:hypothetical protein [Candidatus Pacearchaeota archaeon]